MNMFESLHRSEVRQAQQQYNKYCREAAHAEHNARMNPSELNIRNAATHNMQKDRAFARLLTKMGGY